MRAFIFLYCLDINQYVVDAKTCFDQD